MQAVLYLMHVNAQEREIAEQEARADGLLPPQRLWNEEHRSLIFIDFPGSYLQVHATIFASLLLRGC